ncbi:MAG TPA: hypothetical protein VK790_13110, partial [Solirubrobacteraceae bacterium]|nr:hypothetical protein [Solirubrobacteraceae bacterium]
EQLRRYDAVFPPEQMLVLIYDDFRDDNEATVRRVLRFLDVADTQPIESVEANPTVGVRSVRLDALKQAVRSGQSPAARVLRAGGQALTTPRMRTALEPLLRRAVHGKPPAADARLMADLRRRFKPEVQALGEYLDRDLIALWGYDAIE